MMLRRGSKEVHVRKEANTRGKHLKTRDHNARAHSAEKVTRSNKKETTKFETYTFFNSSMERFELGSIPCSNAKYVDI